MSKHTQITSKDLTAKPFLTQARKVGGRIVHEELTLGSMDEDTFLDTLMGEGHRAIDESEIEEGREKLLAENPHLASQNIHEMLGMASLETKSELGNEFMQPKRAASVKRAGVIADENGDSLNFRRIANAQVELTTDSGEVIETLSNKEFDDLLDSGDYTVL